MAAPYELSAGAESSAIDEQRRRAQALAAQAASRESQQINKEAQANEQIKQASTSQQDLIKQLQARTAGTTPSLVEAQMKATSDRSLAQQLAAAGAVRGGNQAALQRQLARGQSAGGMELTQQVGQAKLQEQQAAQSQLASAIAQQQSAGLQGQAQALTGQQQAMQAQQSFEELVQKGISQGLSLAQAQQQASLAQTQQQTSLEAARIAGEFGLKSTQAGGLVGQAGSLVGGIVGGGGNILGDVFGGIGDVFGFEDGGIVKDSFEKSLAARKSDSYKPLMGSGPVKAADGAVLSDKQEALIRQIEERKANRYAEVMEKLGKDPSKTSDKYKDWKAAKDKEISLEKARHYTPESGFEDDKFADGGFPSSNFEAALKQKYASGGISKSKPLDDNLTDKDVVDNDISIDEIDLDKKTFGQTAKDIGSNFLEGQIMKDKAAQQAKQGYGAYKMGEALYKAFANGGITKYAQGGITPEEAAANSRSATAGKGSLMGIANFATSILGASKSGPSQPAGTGAEASKSMKETQAEAEKVASGESMASNTATEQAATEEATSSTVAEELAAEELAATELGAEEYAAVAAANGGVIGKRFMPKTKIKPVGFGDILVAQSNLNRRLSELEKKLKR